MNTETIAAISTALGASGIGIVRISGERAIETADRIFCSASGQRLSDCESHTIHYGHICDEGQIVDEVLVMLMRGPRSFTAEDTVEINCHGGVYVVKRVLETVIKNGARLAEPGEFTKRAFLNGRMDLSQAEAVIDLIQSQNEYARKASIGQLRGSVSEKIKKLRGDILYEIAFIESALDDPEHISLDGYDEHLGGLLPELKKEIEKLIRSFENGRRITEGIKTVIVGKPNAGKSSVLNLLAGEERAIVTDLAGTTRDVLEETILLDGFSLRVLDTAGIRHTDNVVEKIGIERALEHIKDSDMILYIMDASCPMDENDERIMKEIQDKEVFVLVNKTDLTEDKKTLDALTAGLSPALKREPPILFSAKENIGLEELTRRIQDRFFEGRISFNDQIYITSVRHKKLLTEALDSLTLVENSLENRMPEDFYSIDLMDAYEKLGQIIGEEAGEDLINEIFRRFCMGK